MLNTFFNLDGMKLWSTLETIFDLLLKQLVIIITDYYYHYYFLLKLKEKNKMMEDANQEVCCQCWCWWCIHVQLWTRGIYIILADSLPVSDTLSLLILLKQHLYQHLGWNQNILIILPLYSLKWANHKHTKNMGKSKKLTSASIIGQGTDTGYSWTSNGMTLD